MMNNMHGLWRGLTEKMLEFGQYLGTGTLLELCRNLLLPVALAFYQISQDTYKKSM